MQKPQINYFFLVCSLIITGVLLLVAIKRIEVDTDVVESLPHDNGVLDDAAFIFKHHPMQDQIAIDVHLTDGNPQKLIQIAESVETGLTASGLFSKVGLDDMQRAFPQLLASVIDRLPLLFSADELERIVLPKLTQEALHLKFGELQHSLMNLESIGQAGFIAGDPLGLTEIKLAELASLAPSQDARLYKGRLLSADGRHTLVLAQPSGSGTDTAFARKLTALIQDLKQKVKADHAAMGDNIELTPVGAYRAALDNEEMVRRDVNKAFVMATLGIAILLLLAFPRPLVGLLALLPAIVGTAVSFFVFSLLHDSISIMALGFGGAIISITVDHGIAYLLFLDRKQQTFGHEASREVWAVGLLAALTSIGAFSVLVFSGFLIFEQLGLFAAMGIAFSFLFVHTVFPRIFPCMPPARTRRRLPMQTVADRLASTGSKGLIVALAAGLILMAWLRPQFNVDLSAMNSVSASTKSAEAHFSSVWGDIFNKVYVMTEASSLADLQTKGDRLLALLDEANSEGAISSGFASSSLFPGEERQRSNLAAWKAFWHPQRTDALKKAMAQIVQNYGFDIKGFAPFFEMLSTQRTTAPALAADDAYLSILGISKSPRDGQWRQFTGVTPGKQYDGQKFYDRFSKMAKVFDAQLFTDRMGHLLFNTFGRMLLIIAASVVALLFVFLADWRLTLICLMPLAFALVATLGTLTLMGRHLDIPALMLSIIILGMGIDYTLFIVRSYQRYQDGSHPNFSLIRMSVLMASASTLIGFGVLCTAEHNLLQSAGVTSFLGIGFSVAGAFLILPPILERYFAAGPPSATEYATESEQLQAMVRQRYSKLGPYPRFFSRFKMKLDPMFDELNTILPPTGNHIKTVIDIGSGFGVPACWMSFRYPGATVYGIEPMADRVRVANLALGGSGSFEIGLAPRVPAPPQPADLAFMLDMCHYLDDTTFKLTLRRLHTNLRAEAVFILRVILEPPRGNHWVWRLEQAKMKLQDAVPVYRTVEEICDLISGHAFEVRATRFSGTRQDLAWVVARPALTNAPHSGHSHSSHGT